MKAPAKYFPLGIDGLRHTGTFQIDGCAAQVG
jgi:hypothetical protein